MSKKQAWFWFYYGSILLAGGAGIGAIAENAILAILGGFVWGSFMFFIGMPYIARFVDWACD